MVLSGIENAAVSQQLALNDATLDTYQKTVKSVRSFISASRPWQTTDTGDPMEVHAISYRKGTCKDNDMPGKGKEKDKSGKGKGSDDVTRRSYCEGKGHIARNCRKRISDEKAAGKGSGDGRRGGDL